MSSQKTSPQFPGFRVLSVFLGLAWLAAVTACGPSKGNKQIPPPRPKPERPGATKLDPALLVEGERVYNEYCALCHLTGEGTPGLNPPLINSPLLAGERKGAILNVLKGSQGQSVIDGQKFSGMMAPLDYLADEEIAAVLTYARQVYAKHDDPLVTPEQVAKERD